jgi:hypothetical protein
MAEIALVAIYADFVAEDGITGQLFLWTHEVHPSSWLGTGERQRGHRMINGFVISHRHCGHIRISRRSCSSREGTIEDVDEGAIMLLSN